MRRDRVRTAIAFNKCKIDASLRTREVLAYPKGLLLERRTLIRAVTCQRLKKSARRLWPAPLSLPPRLGVFKGNELAPRVQLSVTGITHAGRRARTGTERETLEARVSQGDHDKAIFFQRIG